MYDFQLETWLTILELKYSTNDLKGDKPQEDMRRRQIKTNVGDS